MQIIAETASADWPAALIEISFYASVAFMVWAVTRSV